MRSLLAAVVILFVAAASIHCSGDEYTQSQVYGCPDRVTFIEHVSPFVERRCGTLDCHGSTARPMRLHSQIGLRHADEANVPGGVATTDLELGANHDAVCGVDPESMSEAALDFGSSAENLLLIKKARGVEGHKGGKVVNELDPGDRCLVGWIRRVPIDQLTADCQAAVDALEP